MPLALVFFIFSDTHALLKWDHSPSPKYGDSCSQNPLPAGGVCPDVRGHPYSCADDARGV